MKKKELKQSVTTRKKTLTVLITGSTSGIGLGIATAFAKEGHNIIFNGLEKEGPSIAASGSMWSGIDVLNGGKIIVNNYSIIEDADTAITSYIQEGLLLTQIKGEFQKIAIPDVWAENMLSEIELWQKGEQQQTKFLQQNLNAELKQIDLQMDKLVNGYLEAVIEKEIYLRKKDQLLKQKSDLKLKHSDFNKDGQIWLEPLRDFVKTLNYAGKLAAMDADLSAYKALSEKVGSNRLLKDKKIVWDWLPSFDLLLQDKGFQACTKKSSDLSELKNGEEKKELLAWRRLRG